MRNVNPNFLTRQADLLPMDKLHTGITIVGVGAIGSFTALALAKMGFSNITVYDDDKVSEENMNSQFYRHTDINRPKVEALYDLIKDFTGVEISTFNNKFDPRCSVDTITLSCVDSMSARSMIFDKVTSDGECKAFIDARMSAEEAALYAIMLSNSDDVAGYRTSLYSDEDAVQERCTAKATMYTVLAISSQICNVVKNMVTHNDYSKTILWSIKEADFIATQTKEDICSFH